MWKTIFPWTGVRGMVQDDSSALHLVCTLFLFLLHHLHLTSAGIRSRRLGTRGYKLMWSSDSRCQAADLPCSPTRPSLGQLSHGRQRAPALRHVRFPADLGLPASWHPDLYPCRADPFFPVTLRVSPSPTPTIPPGPAGQRAPNLQHSACFFYN